jgi:hypothetical protein
MLLMNSCFERRRNLPPPTPLPLSPLQLPLHLPLPCPPLPQVPWPTLRGLVEVALYGGRLDNDNDVRVLQTYIANVFTPEVVPTADKPDARPLIRGLAVPRLGITFSKSVYRVLHRSDSR